MQNSYKKVVNISLANKFVNHIGRLSRKDVKKRRNFFQRIILEASAPFWFKFYKNKRSSNSILHRRCRYKIDLANKFNKFNTIGIDLGCNVCKWFNSTRRKATFLLRLFSCRQTKSQKSKILSGIIKGCSLSGCSLIGGETAEMPGIYSKNNFDLAGFSVGIVSKKKF